MEELIKQIVNKTGISEAQARSAAETVVGFLKGKLPSFSRFIQEGVMSQTLKRSGIRLVEGLAFENLQEGLQDFTTPVVQEVLGRLNSDMPSVDWEKEWSSWAAGRADVALGTLPLVLIGVGMGGVNDLASIAKQTDMNQSLQSFVARWGHITPWNWMPPE